MDAQQEPQIDVREIIQLHETLKFLWDSGHYLPFAFIKRSMMTVNDGATVNFAFGPLTARPDAERE